MVAAQRGARVALIFEQGIEAPWVDGAESLRWFYAAADRFVGSHSLSPDQAWAAFQANAAMVAENSATHTPPQLMAAEVDVISGQPTLGPRHRVYVADGHRPACGHRCLSSRKLLLALAGQWQPPDIPGLKAYLTPVSLAALKVLPQRLLILGHHPLALAIAQAMTRWNVAVTLLTPSPRLLPSEAPLVSDWIAAELAAAGVDLQLGIRPAGVTTTAAGIVVHAESERWTADQLLIGTAPRPAWATLNLAMVGLRLQDGGLPVNRYLQTRHPYIYACGEALGGACLPAIARYEAEVAVDNALFWNRRQVCYNQLPYTLLTQPEFCRVGMTLAQAQQRYGTKAVVVYDQQLERNRKAQALGNTTGFCRLVTHRRGQILGAHLVGLDASEWGQVLVIALKHRLTIKDLANLPTLPQTLTDMVRKTAEQWEGDRWQPGQWRRDWAENWFNWRRSSRR
jgi:pyruvate/2-oxoglutarate dehydrogenase complex dihydrolipoamide dehydrogenase (E3) component